MDGQLCLLMFSIRFNGLVRSIVENQGQIIFDISRFFGMSHIECIVVFRWSRFRIWITIQVIE